MPRDPYRDDDSPHDFHEGGGEEDRRKPDEPGLRDFARRFLKTSADVLNATTGGSTGEEKKRPVGGTRLDAKGLASTVANFTARGREEVIDLVIREVKMYLEKLNVVEEVHSLLTNYSLEVHASVRLKPVADALDRVSEEEAPAEGEGDRPGKKGRGRAPRNRKPTAE